MSEEIKVSILGVKKSQVFFWSKIVEILKCFRASVLTYKFFEQSSQKQAYSNILNIL